MFFMVIEHFKQQNAKAIYRRAQEQGRMLPDGLIYLSSWVEDSFGRCFQLMECEDVQTFQQWTSQWDDLIEFEIIHVVSSAEASAAALTDQTLPHLPPSIW